jgi:triacylglycerol lipase
MSEVIVLAHGLFGFGDLVPGFQPVNYFNKVAGLFTTQVIAPQVDPIGAIEVRGNALADEILQKTNPKDRVHIIGHSMGGLDARHVITHRGDVSPRIATLVTIGTPHAGSKVADAVLDRAPVVEALLGLFPEKLRDQIDAIKNLTTAFCKDFNKRTPDVRGVRYINVAGDASRAESELPFFKLAARLGGMAGKTNDGVVTRESALRDNNEHLDDWPVDHLGEIGWSLETVAIDRGRRESALKKHLDRYKAMIGVLNLGSA